MRFHVWVLVLLPGVLVACDRGPEAAATIKKYRPSVEARFATIKQIGERLKGMPVLSRDGVALDSGPFKLGTASGNPESSATAVMHEAPRVDLTVQSDYSVDTESLWWCARLLGEKYYAERSSKDTAEAHLGLCANAKYLLVVRVLQSTYPKVDEGKGTFQSGSAAGEVRVFNLGSAKDLGGFRFKARNSDLVMSREGKGRDYSAVSSDLNSQVRAQVRAGITKHLGGS